MRTRTLACLAALLAAATAFGQEFGGTLGSDTGYAQTSSGTFSLYERADVWAKLPLAPAVHFQVQASFAYSLDTASMASSLAAAPFGADLDVLKLSLSMTRPQPDILSASLAMGRYPFSDPTRLVFSSKMDGFSLGFQFPVLQASFHFGTTGLLFNNASGVVVSATDRTLSADASRLFGSPRFVGMSELAFSPLFGQSIVLAILVQEDLRPFVQSVTGIPDSLLEEWSTAYQPGKGGALGTQYATLKASGQIVNGLFYEAFSTLGMGRLLSYLPDTLSSTGYSYQYAPVLSFLGGGNLTLYLPSLLSSVVGLRGICASGDQDADTATEGNSEGSATQFIPLTATALGTVFSPKLTNIAFLELSWMVKPIQSLRFQTGAKLMGFFRPTTGPISLPGLSPDSTSPYLGTEVDWTSSYRILSDLGVSLNLGAFVPGKAPIGAFDPGYGGSDLQFAGRLSVSLSL